MTSPPESEAAMAEPSEAMQAKARELLKLITSGGYVDYPHRRHVVATFLTELLAEARAGAEGKWVATSERFPEGKARPVLVLVKDDAEMFADVWDWMPRLGPLSSFHKNVVYWRELPPLPPAPKASGR